MILKSPKIVIYGAGAIGLSIAGWLSPFFTDLYVITRKKSAEMLQDGLNLYKKGKRKEMENIPINALYDIAEIPNPDLIIITVKNFDLEDACKDITSKIQSKPIVIGIQNGVINQTILHRYFEKCIYGIGTYNAWREEENIVGYQNKGLVLIGTHDNSLSQEMAEIANLLSVGSPWMKIENFHDASLCKIVINLTNAIFTLVGQGFKEILDIKTLKKIITSALLEGVQILRALNVKEVTLGSAPGWKTIELGMKLPDFISMIIFKKNLKKLVISSMSYDIIKKGRHKSELDNITGYLISLAEENGIKAPINKAIYEMAKSNFELTPYNPIEPFELWNEIQKNLQLNC